MYFTYSLGFGIGAGLLYTTSLFVSNRYFKRQRALAVGVICAGGGSGYLAFGPLIQLCLDEFGWASTCRLLAAAFVLPALTSLFYGSENMTKNEETLEDSDPLKETNHAKTKIVDWSVWKNSKYTVSTASMTLAGLAHYIPQIYLVGICETFGMTSTKSSQLLIFIGLSTLIVRITVGILLNSLRVSTTFIFQFSQLVNSLVQLSIPFAYKYEHFIAISVFYGCADGAFTTSLNNILLNTVRPDQVSSAFGFGCIVNSLTIAAGAPLAGLLIRHTKSYNPAFFAGSVVLLISSLLPSVRHLVVALTVRFARRPHSLDANVELCKEHNLQEVHLTEHYTVSQDLAISSVPQSLLVCNPTKVVRV